MVKITTNLLTNQKSGGTFNVRKRSIYDRKGNIQVKPFKSAQRQMQ